MTVKAFIKLAIIAGFSIFWYKQYYPDIKLVLSDKYFEHKKCSEPITYRIARLDAGFNLSVDEAKKLLIDAEDIWEIPTSRNLFEYSQTKADIDVHFVFDERQKSSNQLDIIDNDISKSKSNIEFSRLSFEEMKVRYESEISSLKSYIENYNAEKKQYENMVNIYNQQGIGDRQALIVKRNSLDSMYSNIKQKESMISELKNNLSLSAESINKSIESLNNSINKYNNISKTQGEVFNEGEYVYNKGKKDIYIYHFTSENVLKRLFAHELGHALGMDHIENESSIMHYLNSSKNTIPTTEDMNEFSMVCSK